MKTKLSIVLIVTAIFLQALLPGGEQSAARRRKVVPTPFAPRVTVIAFPKPLPCETCKP